MTDLQPHIRVGVIGGTGYTGAELLRLLALHPHVAVVFITSRAEAGKPVTDLFANLTSYERLQFSDPDACSFQDCDVVFSATPNGVAMRQASQVLNAGAALIDLAADFRLRDPDSWARWYGEPHACVDLLQQAVYGLPEMNRERLAAQRLIANPGCYPTASILGLMPLVKHGLSTDRAIIIDAKSGVTGAGRTATVNKLFSEINDSFKAYAAAGHRHLPEITQVLTELHPQQHAPKLTFVPHLVPMLRGIHATIYVDFDEYELRIDEMHAIYTKLYESEPFVKVLPLGAHPATRSVKGSNRCQIALHQCAGTGRLVILSVIDNLTKGAAGQAIQNMNLCMGLSETTGLTGLAMLP